MNSPTKASLTVRIAVATTRRPTVRLAACEAQNDGDDDPAERILEDRRRDEDLAEIPALEVRLAHDGGDDLDRGDR